MQSNLVLFSVGISIAAIGLLGWIVYLNDRKSVTNRTFFYFSLISICWNLSNFLVYRVTDPNIGLLFVRLNIFFAVWYSFFLFNLFYVFPTKEGSIPRKILFIILPLTTVVSILALTPLVLDEVLTTDASGHVARISNGPAIPFFGATAVGLISGAIFKLLQKIRRASGVLRNQLQYIAAGAVITFTLHIIFNLIFPTLYNNPKYIPLGALFTFPLIFFTSYAIRRHRLLNIRVFSTEIISLLVLSLTFLEVLISKNTFEIIFRSLLFATLFFFFFLLVRSVRHEAEQRAQLKIVNEQLKKANERLQQMDQAKSEFVSIASHQLRTPMTGIMGYLSMLVGGDFGAVKPEHRKIMLELLSESQRMIRLINLFLNVSKIEAGKFTMDLEPASLEAVVEHEVKELTKEATDKGLKLVYQRPSKPLPTMNLDADKLKDVLLNLIDNAIKYTHTGAITVSVTEKPDSVRVAIKDTGIGIKPEEARELFNKFVRGSGIAQIHPDGSGLGLFIAKRIVEAHGGRIWVESPGVGKGSTFYFELPMHAPPGRFEVGEEFVTARPPVPANPEA